MKSLGVIVDGVRYHCWSRERKSLGHWDIDPGARSLFPLHVWVEPPYCQVQIRCAGNRTVDGRTVQFVMEVEWIATDVRGDVPSSGDWLVTSMGAPTVFIEERELASDSIRIERHSAIDHIPDWLPREAV